MYMTSTTGFIPAMAAPTARPTMALSLIGVSRTRPGKLARQTSGGAEDVAARADVDPCDEDLGVRGEFVLQGETYGVHGAEDLCVTGDRSGFGDLGAGCGDEVVEGFRGGLGGASGLLDRCLDLLVDPFVDRVGEGDVDACHR
jgi:hypothetical protein